MVLVKGWATFVCQTLPPAVFLPCWPSVRDRVTFLISGFQNMKNAKLYCTFGENESSPFRAEKESLLQSRREAHHAPTRMKRKRVRSCRSGTLCRPGTRTGMVFLKRFPIHLQHPCSSFMDVSTFSSSAMSYFKTVFLPYSNTVQIGNLIVIILFLSYSFKTFCYGEIILGTPSTNPLNTFLISLMNYCGW